MFSVFRCKQFVWMDDVHPYKLPVNGFKWAEKLSKFNERFIKSYNENSENGYFLEVDVEYPINLLNSHKDLPFLPERKKLEK